MELLKLLSASEIFAQVVSFLLLLFLLRIFFWKKVLGILDARKERIADGLKRIEDSQAEVAKLKSDYEAKLGAIEVIVREKIQEATEQGRKITEEVRKKAYEEAQDIIENSRTNIKYELAKAREELKEQIIDLTIKATENLIQEKLTEEDDKKIVENFLEKIDKVK
ncbi:MAG: F0F1 ATP synthase subunit B [Candidatus Omnitrophica bacterium]|nr:F0F1 ATP synthase subunit B [Candidatus Omnitrophota bacterium]